jgi:hypothetical protein
VVVQESEMVVPSQGKSFYGVFHYHLKTKRQYYSMIQKKDVQ